MVGLQNFASSVQDRAPILKNGEWDTLSFAERDEVLSRSAG